MRQPPGGDVSGRGLVIVSAAPPLVVDQLREEGSATRTLNERFIADQSVPLTMTSAMRFGPKIPWPTTPGIESSQVLSSPGSSGTAPR
jgi:hypothetical protein